MIDSERYVKAMIKGDTALCVLLEELYGLYGYPPELVSIGIKAAESGEDPQEAILKYISGE